MVCIRDGSYPQEYPVLESNDCVLCQIALGVCKEMLDYSAGSQIALRCMLKGGSELLILLPRQVGRNGEP